jgi:tetratricopeptide (TPR) repeat protein
MSGDRFAFCHALIRETLVEELSTSRRVRMHARIAEILEKTGGSLSELAYQYGEAAGANTAAKAVDYAMRAAEQAMESLAFEEAVRLCESVRHLTEEDDAARCGLLLLLARAQSKMGEPGSSKSSAVEAAAVARRLGDFGSLARAALIAGSWPESPHLPWTEDLMAEALSALPPDDSVERAQVLARLATMRARSDIDAGRDLEQQALAMADRLDDPPTTAFVTRAAIAALWDPLQPEQRMAWAERLGELGEQLADKELQLMSQSWFTHFALETGDRDAFDRCCARFEVEAQDLPVSGSWFEIVRSLLSLIEGRFEETSDRLRRIDELGQQPGWEMMGGFATIQRITLLWLRGRVGEMAAALTPPFDTWARSEAGEPIDAAWVDEALQLRTNKGWGTMWESVVTAIGGVAVRHGSDDACRQVYEILAPLEGRHYVVPTALTTYGPHARLLGALAGRLGMWAEAERLFELCLKSCVELRSPPLVAQAQCEYAEMLSAKGDHERAHALMREALATAGRLGMAEVKRRAGQLLD